MRWPLEACFRACGGITGQSEKAAAALLTLLATLFGLGLGPLLIGRINDALATQLGAAAIRYSLLTGAATSTLGALFFWAAAGWVRRDIARASDS